MCAEWCGVQIAKNISLYKKSWIMMVSKWLLSMISPGSVYLNKNPTNTTRMWTKTRVVVGSARGKLFLTADYKKSGFELISTLRSFCVLVWEGWRVSQHLARKNCIMCVLKSLQASQWRSLLSISNFTIEFKDFFYCHPQLRRERKCLRAAFMLEQIYLIFMQRVKFAIKRFKSFYE